MAAKQKHATREAWLSTGINLMKQELFVPQKFKIPKLVRVSCGFPSTGAFAHRKQRIGECWYPKTGNSHQLFVSPVLTEPVKVLDVLAHEIVHTVAGKQAGHMAPFKKIALAIGLEGPMRSTHAGPKLEKYLKKIAKELGTYPHDALNQFTKLKKSETGRMLKGECPSCSYKIRITQKWIDEVGLPECPACNQTLEQD